MYRKTENLEKILEKNKQKNNRDSRTKMSRSAKGSKQVDLPNRTSTCSTGFEYERVLKIAACILLEIYERRSAEGNFKAKINT